MKQKKISYKSQTAQGTNPLFDYIKKQEDEGDEEKCEKK
jgi:hypothetical protein